MQRLRAEGKPATLMTWSPTLAICKTYCDEAILLLLTRSSTVAAAARDFYGFTSAMSYAKLVLSACSKDPILEGMTAQLPPRHLVMKAIQKYLDHVYTLLPFFDETGLYYSVDAVYNSQADSNSAATDYDHWCVRFILAIASAAHSEQRGDSFNLEALGHVSAALKHAEGVLRPGTISSVQALLFLAEYATVDPHHFDSWSLIGAASRAMLDLGLHQDPPKGTAISKPKLELRRRVYWSVYMLDRSTSIVQTRAFSFSDASARVSTPPLTRSEAPRGVSRSQKWLKGFDHAIYLMKLRSLQSAWYHDLFQSGREPWTDPYPYLWRTCQELSNWFKELSENTSTSFRAFFELEMLYSFIYLLAPSPRVPVTIPYVQNAIFEHCISYANLMTAVINDKSHVAPVTFYDAMRVYMTGRQFIDVLAGNQDRLLSGVLPEPPQVMSDSPPAPPLPSPPDPRQNVMRSISCIKQLTDCLGRFGQRWGYMSWRDSFENVAEPTLLALNQRMWELQEVPTTFTNQRRPSEWHHASSSGSVPSVGHLSRESSYQMPQHSPYTTSTMPYGQPFFPPPDGSSYHASQVGLVQTQVSPPLAFSQSQAGMSDRPNQQFATWSGLDTFGHDYAHTQPGAEDDEVGPPI